MKTLIKLLMMAVLTGGLLHAAGFEKTATFRTTKVVMSVEKPLAVGSNTLELMLTLDAKVSEGAAVSLKVFMPAMPGMPAMESVVDATSLGGGKYKADVNFSMGGTWQIHILITPKTGKRIRVKTSVNI
ncbi:FixH family protein [Sulfurimonas sp. HSL3-7]|uniref:FixH family protein n=1 Tax=Sulfonitrofixus jiaomeiensis TaxID=3131938 RepID=UPI0031F979DD